MYSQFKWSTSEEDKIPRLTDAELRQLQFEEAEADIGTYKKFNAFLGRLHHRPGPVEESSATGEGILVSKASVETFDSLYNNAPLEDDKQPFVAADLRQQCSNCVPNTCNYHPSTIFHGGAAPLPCPTKFNSDAQDLSTSCSNGHQSSSRITLEPSPGVSMEASFGNTYDKLFYLETGMKKTNNSSMVPNEKDTSLVVVDHTYYDFSLSENISPGMKNVAALGQSIDSVLRNEKVSVLNTIMVHYNQKRNCQTFPMRLMKMLSSSDVSEGIQWLPHGRSFIVVDSKKFEEEIIPRYFTQLTLFKSFLRQVVCTHVRTFTVFYINMNIAGRLSQIFLYGLFSFAIFIESVGF